MAPGNTSEGRSQKQRVSDTFDLTADSYDTVIPFFAHWGARLVALAELSAGQRVLDVCCGTGASLFGAASAVGTSGSILGIDLSPAMVESAQDAARRLGADNVEVRVGDAEGIDADDRSVDAVLCGFGLMFLPDLRTALAEMARVLRRGGRVVASAPEGELAAGLEVRKRWAERLAGGNVATPPGPFDPVPAMESAGFAEIEVLDETEDFTFDDGHAYVQWCRSHGARAVFEVLDEDQQRAFADEMAAAAEGERTGAGIVMTTRARFWRAVVPRDDG